MGAAGGRAMGRLGAVMTDKEIKRLRIVTDLLSYRETLQQAFPDSYDTMVEPFRLELRKAEKPILVAFDAAKAAADDGNDLAVVKIMAALTDVLDKK